jgi:hypothetical protein
MRRFVVVLVSAILAVSISACSSGEAPIEDTSKEAVTEESTVDESKQEVDSKELGATEGESTNSGSSLFSGAEWVENETTDGVPVPSFSVVAESVDVSESESLSIVSGCWINVPDNEIQEYVQAVKDAGFTNSVSEDRFSNSYVFSADNREDRSDFDYKTVSIFLSSVKDTSGNYGDVTLRITVNHHHHAAL